MATFFCVSIDVNVKIEEQRKNFTTVEKIEKGKIRCSFNVFYVNQNFLVCHFCIIPTSFFFFCVLILIFEIRWCDGAITAREDECA